MDVFLLPVGPDRYELYCEVEDEPLDESDTDDDVAGPGFRGVKARILGFFRGLKLQFQAMLREAERERREGRRADPSGGFLSRTRARVMRWVAESIAEQRLLWTLRSQTEATLHYPLDLSEADAIERMRKQLGRDFDKHQFWLVVDSLIFIASGLLALVPGPNILAYYFAFRMVGHFFSLRGARQALGPLVWSYAASAPLASLRAALDLEPEARAARLEAIAAELGLEHLPRFVERSATTA
jgi:hypothetical protein